MNHLTNDKFWVCFNQLPINIQKTARKKLTLLNSDSRHPSLHLKKVSVFWSFRISRHYRAIGIQKESAIVWFWIGVHSEYDKIIGKS